MGVISFLDRGAELFPDRDCLVDDTGRRTYRVVSEHTWRIAAALRADGFSPGDRAALLSPNCSDAFQALLGIYRAGGVFVPLSAQSVVDENIYTLEHCDVSVLFIHGCLAERLPAIRRHCPAIRLVVCLGEAGGLDLPYLAEWAARDLPRPPEIAEDPQTTVSIYSTGGTTGRPKGVPFTSLTWDTAAANFLSGLATGPGPVYLAVTPMTHAAGTIALPLLSVGATIVIQAGFEAASVLQAIERHRVTHLWLPPTAIYMLLAEKSLKQRDYSSLRYFMYSAAPMSVEKLKECLSVFGPVLTQLYGLTEAPVFATCLEPADHDVEKAPQRLASCGRSMLFTQVGIMDDMGALLAPGERGEVVLRGNLVMPGYYKNEEATAEVMKEGWFRTGDIGYKDEDGYLYLIDRKKNLIISGGYNIYPAEVERAVLGHPAVQDCSVVGIPDEKWGEAVKAVVELKPGFCATEEEIMSLCRARLGSVKAPKSVEFNSLPRTPVGKVDGRAVRARYWQGLDRTI